MMAFTGKPPENVRLDSWKAIAAYLGRDVSTVIRWEKDKGLPVHRLPGGKRQAVFALSAEIDAWLVGHPPEAAAGERPAPSAEAPVAVDQPRSTAAAVPQPVAQGGHRWVTAAALVVAAGALAAWLSVTETASSGEVDSPGVSFARHDIPVASPYSIAAGDLNGDGWLDLAVTAYRTNLLYSFLGQGDGSLRLAAEAGTGIKPDGVTLADFNGDGALDAATANRESNSVSILHGTGDGRFRPRSDHDVGAGPRGVMAGDLDGDGSIDLAITNYDADSLTLHYASAAQPRPATTHAVGASPYQVRVADLNGDGLPDLVIGNTNEEVAPADAPSVRPHTLAILLGSGGGAFTPHARYLLGRGSSGIAVADLNGDGRADLAITSFEDHLVHVLTGKGDGTFDSPAAVATGAAPLDIAAADIDADGRLDLVVANAHDKSVSLLRGNGDATFAARVDFAVDSYPKSIAVGDFNQDGRLDIVVSNFLDNSISVLLNTTPPAADRP